MKLLLPSVTAKDVQKLTAALPPDTAAEFYTGISLAAWDDRFGPHEDINRMSAFGKSANGDGFREIEEICRDLGENELYITLNAGSYSPDQEEFLQDVIRTLGKLHVTGVILGDVHLADTVIECGMKVVASTMLGVYNADMARFCANHGFGRLIFPRDISLEDMKEIMDAVPDVEYECFLMRNGCRYSDANCLARHSGKFGAVCTYLDKAYTELGGDARDCFAVHDEALFNHLLYTQAFHKFACGICAVWDLIHMGITAGKLVGRADGADCLLQDIRVLCDNIRLAERCASRQEFLDSMIKPRNYDTLCFKGMNCYYPEIRYGIEEKK